MKHTDFKNIIEAAQKLTGSKAETKNGALKALKTHLKAHSGRGLRKKTIVDGIPQEVNHYYKPGYGLGKGNPRLMSARAAWNRYQWRQRAERGAETVMRAQKLKTRWDDLTSKRPRDSWNRQLSKTRRTLTRNQYGALYMSPIENQFACIGELGMRYQWLNSPLAAPAGYYNALECIRDIENGADEHGGWEQRSEWDNKGRGERVTVDIYGFDAAAHLYVIQVRQSYRRHKNYFLEVRKSYFLIGHNENGNPFAHAISSGIVHGAIKRDSSPESPVRAAQAWIWGIDERKLRDVLRNGDVALIPANCPQKNITVFQGGEYRVDDDVAADHHLIADEIRANGAIYAKNPMIYHRKGQHPAVSGDGWFKVVVGRRADFWDFARPTKD